MKRHLETTLAISGRLRVRRRPELVTDVARSSRNSLTSLTAFCNGMFVRRRRSRDPAVLVCVRPDARDGCGSDERRGSHRVERQKAAGHVRSGIHRPGGRGADAPRRRPGRYHDRQRQRLPRRDRGQVGLGLAGRCQSAGQRDRAPARVDQHDLAAAHRVPGPVHAGRLRAARDRPHPGQERRPHDDDEPVVVHGSAGIIGFHGFFLQSGGAYDVGVMAFFLFQVVFMETAGYIIIGAIAERINFRTFILAELAMGALIYPIFGMWVWGGGWLAKLGQSADLGHGAVDFAGSGVVHSTGGWAALALAMLLGPRIGKYRKDGTARAFPGHNLGYVVIGTLILVFGWMGFNPGSTFGATDLRIAIVAVNTLLSACAAAVAAMAWTNAKWGKPDISMTCNGMLAGLVAITAPCAFVAPWASLVI